MDTKDDVFFKNLASLKENTAIGSFQSEIFKILLDSRNFWRNDDVSLRMDAFMTNNSDILDDAWENLSDGTIVKGFNQMATTKPWYENRIVCFPVYGGYKMKNPIKDICYGKTTPKEIHHLVAMLLLLNYRLQLDKSGLTVG